MKGKKAIHNVTLLVEGYPRLGFKAFSTLLGDGTSGICISRLHPEYVVQKFGLTGAKFYWLTGNKGANSISPKSLSPLIKAVRSDAKGKKLYVYLDGLEYLLLWNDLKKVLSVMEELGEHIAKNGGSLYISIDPLTMEQKDLDRLYEMFSRTSVTEAINKQAQQSAADVPGSSAQLGGGLEGPRASTASP